MTPRFVSVNLGRHEEEAQGAVSVSEGPVVLVVGGSSGIGLAAARQLSAAGVRVALGARDELALRRAGAALAAEPLLVPVDVTDPASVERCVARVVATHGRLDA